MTEAESNSLTKQDLYDIAMGTAGFSDKMATQFADGFPKFLRFYAKLGIKAAEVKPLKIVSGKLKGEIIAFTGFRDKHLSEVIVRNGGLAKDSIGKDTTILLVKHKGSGSSKEKLALQRGIKVFTPQEFVKKFGLTLWVIYETYYSSSVFSSDRSRANTGTVRQVGLQA